MKFACAILPLLFVTTPAHVVDDGVDRDITYKGVPWFLMNHWKVIMGCHSTEGANRLNGAFILAARAAFSGKNNPTLGSDYLWFNISSTVQHNLADKEGGFDTFFELRSDSGTIILMPYPWAWKLCLRVGSTGPYRVYSIIFDSLLDQEKQRGEESLKKFYDSEKESLEKSYPALSKGLDEK